MGLLNENGQYNDPLHIDTEDYKISHPRETYYLNKRLIDRQNCWTNVPQIIEAHLEKLDLFDEIDAGKWNDILPAAAKQLKQIEFKMQRLWKFGEDARFHEWYLIPKCECPKMDNADMRGTDYSVINAECPVHGKRK